jgi:hypothetical protein
LGKIAIPNRADIVFLDPLSGFTAFNFLATNQANVSDVGFNPTAGLVATNDSIAAIGVRLAVLFIGYSAHKTMLNKNETKNGAGKARCSVMNVLDAW